MDNVLQVIGHTPLVRMNAIPKEEGVKCEVCKYSITNIIRTITDSPTDTNQWNAWLFMIIIAISIVYNIVCIAYHPIDGLSRSSTLDLCLQCVFLACCSG